jgi:hypothetical protein
MSGHTTKDGRSYVLGLARRRLHDLKGEADTIFIVGMDITITSMTIFWTGSASMLCRKTAAKRPQSIAGTTLIGAGGGRRQRS